MREHDISAVLLEWYDVHARELPWRIPPAARHSNQCPDPYRIWLSEVMLQQTTVAAVKGYFERFTTRWPNVAALAAAQDAEVMAEWAGLGYYARARNLLKCARAITDQHNGIFPQTRDTLLLLPGIGPYTASAIAAIAFKEPAVVVDANVERVMARLYAIKTPLPDAKPELTDKAAILTPTDRPGDHAQAVMDLGATICTPRNPSCSICPVKPACLAQKGGFANDLPQKRPKPAKPTRLGNIYVAWREDGCWLLETRPNKGLLGGMLGWPGSQWGDEPQQTPPLNAQWQELHPEVRHTFTHFHLRLRVFAATVPLDARAHAGEWHPLLRPDDLPTVMRKVHSIAVKTLFETTPA